MNFLDNFTLSEKWNQISNNSKRFKLREVPMRLGVISSIRRFIHLRPEGRIFTTRDCLAFGSRAAVDQALARLVHCERIRRLARGVFVKDWTMRRKFALSEIARAKAEAFGRMFADKARQVVDPFSKEKSESAGHRREAPMFWIDGRSSKFKVEGEYVYLRHAAPRKLKLSQSDAGEAARALWNLGKRSCSPLAFSHATRGFSRSERLEYHRLIKWMPAWLSDQIKVRHWDKLADILALR